MEAKKTKKQSGGEDEGKGGGEKKTKARNNTDRDNGSHMKK